MNKQIAKLGELSLKIPGIDWLSEYVEGKAYGAIESVKSQWVDEETEEQVQEGINNVRDAINISSRQVGKQIRDAGKSVNVKLYRDIELDVSIFYTWLLDLAAGMFCFSQGLMASVNNDDLLDANRSVIKIMLKQMGKIYLGLIIIGIIVFPVVAGVALLRPSILVNIGLMVPMWSFSMARSEAQRDFSDAFMNELNRIDPELADYLEQSAKKEKRKSWFRSIKNKIRKSGRFTMYTLLINVLGYVPVVGGSISFLLQWILTAETMGWNLLMPYFNREMKKDVKSQRKFMDKHWFKIIGFSLPVVLVGFLPGAMLLSVYAQAGTAHLVELTHFDDAGVEVEDENEKIKTE